MFTLAAALIGSALVGAGVSAWSAHQNRKAQKSTNAIEIELANTAHQREVADLKEAGLNPVLSASGHGAAVPTLTAPQYTEGEGINNAISSAKDVAASINNTKMTNAQVDNLKATNENLHVQNDNLQADTAIKHQQLQNMQADRFKTLADTYRIWSETTNPGSYGNILRNLGQITGKSIINDAGNTGYPGLDAFLNFAQGQSQHSAKPQPITPKTSNSAKTQRTIEWHEPSRQTRRGRMTRDEMRRTRPDWWLPEH